MKFGYVEFYYFLHVLNGWIKETQQIVGGADLFGTLLE